MTITSVMKSVAWAVSVVSMVSRIASMNLAAEWCSVPVAPESNLFLIG